MDQVNTMTKKVQLLHGHFKGSIVRVLEESERSLRVELPNGFTAVLPKESNLCMQYYTEVAA